MTGERLRAALPYAVMLAASVALYWAASQIDESGAGDVRLGPAFWPKLIVVAMGALCVLGLLRGLVTSPTPARASAAAPASAAAAAPANPAMLVAGTAIIVGYVVLVPWLGFFVATTAFLALFAWVGGFRRPLACTLLGVAGALLLVIVFMRIAYISLPLGEGPLRALSVALLALLGVR